MPKIVPVSELDQYIGAKLPPSDWLTIDQERIDLFADATNDYQFIHVDPEAAAQTVYGGTVAHGFLILSLLAYLHGQSTVIPEGTMMGLNYGSNEVRYLNPVKPGNRIRSHSELLEVTRIKPRRWLLKSLVTVEIEKVEKPALTAELLGLFIIGR